MKESATDCFSTYIKIRPELVQLKARLMDTFKSPETVSVWMRSSLPSLGNISPLAVIKSRQIDEVNRVLDCLDWGIYT